MSRAVPRPGEAGHHAHPSPRRPRPLWVLLVPVVVMIAAIGVFAVYQFTSYERARTLKAWEGRLKGMADDRERALVAWVGDQFSDARLLASTPAIEDASSRQGSLPEAQRAQVALILDQVVKIYGQAGVWLLDSKGMPAAQATSSPPGVPETAERLVRPVLEGGSQGTIDFFRMPSGGPAVGICVPSGGKAGETPGAVLVVTSPDRWMYPLLQSEPLPTRTGESLLLERDGAQILYLSPLGHHMNAPLNLRVAYDQPGLAGRLAVDGIETFGEFEDYRGVRVLSATKAIRGTPWGLVAKVDTREALAEYRRTLALSLFALGLLLLGIAGASGTLLARQRLLYLEESRLSEARLRAIFAAMTDVVLVLSREGRYLEIAPTNPDLLYKPAEELIGRTLHELFPPGQADFFHQAVLRALEMGNTTDIEYGLNIGEKEILFEAKLSPMSPDAVVLVARDVTERKRTEEALKLHRDHLEEMVVQRTAQLQEANKELEAFSFSVSHDLRAPLRALDGFSRILEDEHSGALDVEGRRLLGVIRTNAKKMGQLIDDLLTFSRLGRKPIARETVEVAALVRNAWDELQPERWNRTVELGIGELPPCEADPSLLKQVWMNLLINALKFTRGRDPALIEVGSCPSDGETAYFIKDNGVGFDAKYAHKLFGVFQRLHRMEDFEGTGVGLAIAQRIVHRHGGRIWAHAEVEKGAIFYFTVPEESAWEAAP